MRSRAARPAVSDVIPRRRLFRQLDGGRPLTWVWGPPGSGKSALVASYLHARRSRSFWYRLHAADADGAALLRALNRGTRRAGSRAHRVAAASWAAVAHNAFVALYDRVSGPFVLALDDYHAIPAAAPLHEILRDAVELLPPRGRIIVTSRMAPPAAFARLRASRAIAEIEWADLRMTVSEARRLGRTLGSSLPAQRITALHARTDGWVGGLVLALHERRRPSEERRGVPDAVADYFACEVLGDLDRDTRDLLLRTAILPRFTSAMAEALTGRPGAGRTLAELYRRNAFIIRHAAPEAVWEYSGLFRSFLLRQAYAAWPPERRREIQRQAARLLSSQGERDTAMALLSAAKDWDGMAALLATHASALVAEGHVRLIGGWLGAMPEDLIRRNAWLLYWRGMSRTPADPAQGRADFEAALDGFCTGDDANGAILAWAAAVRTFPLEHEDYRPLDSWIERFQKLERQFPGFPSREAEAGAVSSMLIALSCRQPHRPEIKVWAARTLELTRAMSDPAIQLQGMSAVLTYQVWSGDFASAQAVATDLRIVASRPEAPVLERINALLSIARLQWLTAEFIDARAAIDAALALGREHAVELFTSRLLGERAQAALSEGDRSAARRWLAELRRDIGSQRRGDRVMCRLLVGWAALLAGEASAVLGEQELAVTEAWECGMPALQCLAHLFAALTLDAAGIPGASIHLTTAGHIARGMESAILTFTARLAEAHLAVNRGDEGRALQILADVLPIGRTRNFVNAWAWRPAMMAELATRALDAELDTAYVDRLVRGRRLTPLQPPVHLEMWPWPVKVFTLGRFEVLIDELPVRFAGKAQKKPIALLQALVAFGGRDVVEHRLAEVLWPDADGDAAHQALAVTLHRLRRLLGHEQAVGRSHGRIHLSPSHCWVDVWAIEETLERAEAAIARSPVRDHEWAASIRWTDRAVALYRGEFLAGDANLAIATVVSTRLKERLLRQLRKIARVWEGIGDWQTAAESYERAVVIDQCAEDVYHRLIAAYRRLDRRGDAMLAYQRCRQALAALGVAPSPETEALIRNL